MGHIMATRILKDGAFNFVARKDRLDAGYRVLTLCMAAKVAELNAIVDSYAQTEAKDAALKLIKACELGREYLGASHRWRPVPEQPWFRALYTTMPSIRTTLTRHAMTPYGIGVDV